LVGVGRVVNRVNCDAVFVSGSLLTLHLEAFGILFESSCDSVAYVSYFALALVVLEAREECMHRVVICLIVLNLFVVGQGDSCGPIVVLKKRGVKTKMSARAALQLN
jgi:hypothetical protein